MGSKKYKNKVCVYCRKNKSEDGEHIFPRKMFPKLLRENIPKAPSCRECNNLKSNIENYLLSVLPLAATYNGAEKELPEAAKRIHTNKKLYQELKDNTKFNLKEMSIPFDIEKLHSFTNLACYGLIWHHWKVYLSEHYVAKSFIPSLALRDKLDSIFDMGTIFKVNNKLCDGIIEYEGMMGEDKDISIWAIKMLGVTMQDSNQRVNVPNGFSICIIGDKKTVDAIVPQRYPSP